MTRRALILTLLLSLIIPVITLNNLFAQEINENNFVQYTTAQGLSQNTITGIAQDSTGYIWASTTLGLNRFNGTKFIQFHSTDDSLSLPGELLTGMTWLDKHRLAVFTGGAHIIDTRTTETKNIFIPYHDKQYAYKFNTVIAGQGNEDGDIFLLTRSGFYHFNKNCQLVFRFDYYTPQQTETTGFGFGRDLLWIDANRLLITSTFGLYSYDIARKIFKKMTPLDCPVLGQFTDYPDHDYEFFQSIPGVFFIMDSNADSLIYINVAENKKVLSQIPFTKAREHFDYRSEILTVNDTLIYITDNTSGFYKIRLYPSTGKVDLIPKKYFPTYYCRHMIEDRNHHLWVATTKGLFREDNRRSNVSQGTLPSSLEVDFPKITLDGIEGTSKYLFAGTLGDAGVLEFDKQQKFIRRFSFGKSVKDADNITSVAAADDNTLLVGTNGPLYQLNLQTSSITKIPLENWFVGKDWIADLYRDRNRNIWIAASSLYKYDAVTKKVTLIPSDGKLLEKIQRPNSIKQDAEGNIWVSGHGLIRFNTRSNTFDRLIDSFPYIKLPDRQVNAFTADQQNNLWINSNNNGLICYNIEKQTFRQFTRDDGLPDNNIASMIVIGNKLWIAAYAGIACMDLNTYRITNFGKEDGFPDQPIPKGTNFYYDDHNNKLYIGFANSLVGFDPSIIYQKSQIPHLFIESLTVGNETRYVLPGKDIPAPWRDNEITVTIGSINFFTSSSQQYAYRIITDESCPWHQLGEQNTFSVSNLSPGHHRIQVKIFSTKNRWPEQIKEIGVTIAPPFWNELWFYAFCTAILIILVYILLSWRTGTIRRKERAKTRIQKLKADEYKNQFELEQISNYFSSSLAGKKKVDEVLWDVSKNLIGRMNFTDCMIYLWNSDKSKMIQKASHGPKGDPVAINEKVFDVLPGQGIVGHVMQTKEPLLITDTRTDPRYRVDDIARLSELCVPIIHNDELIGVIDSEHHNINHFKERDVKILTTIATLVGNKIKQIESEQSLEIKQKEIAYINQQLAEAQLSALQTQMNPHFIFNSLNSIKGMILANETQKASRYLSKFAQMIRITLSQSKEIFTTLHENMEHLENYLTMEKLRFDDSFTYRISVDDEIDKEEILIPTLMIQPLAENAIWHGLMPQKGEKKLTIRFTRLDEAISCIIEDNGIGIKRSEELKQFNRSTHQSVGLTNLRNRIKIMNEKYHTCCTLQITDLNEINKNKTGTCVVLRFKIISNKPHL